MMPSRHGCCAGSGGWNLIKVPPAQQCYCCSDKDRYTILRLGSGPFLVVSLRKQFLRLRRLRSILAQIHINFLEKG